MFQWQSHFSSHATFSYHHCAISVLPAFFLVEWTSKMEADRNFISFLHLWVLVWLTFLQFPQNIRITFRLLCGLSQDNLNCLGLGNLSKLSGNLLEMLLNYAYCYNRLACYSLIVLNESTHHCGFNISLSKVISFSIRFNWCRCYSNAALQASKFLIWHSSLNCAFADSDYYCQQRMKCSYKGQQLSSLRELWSH